MSQAMAKERGASGEEALNAESRQVVLDVVSRLKTVPGALLPVLHGVQDALGYVPSAAVPLIANELNMTRADIHGMLSFYHFFRTEPSGRHVVYLCRAEACQSVGSVALEKHAKQRLGIDFHETTADGRVTLEPVYCLGNCACGPSVLVDKELHANVDAASFDALVDGLSAKTDASGEGSV